MKKWIVAYNLPTASWSSGGSQSEYPAPHWDVYEVWANTSDDAETKGRKLRRQHRALSERQAALLGSLRDGVRSEADDHRLILTIEILEHEVPVGRQLAGKGLISMCSEDGRLVRLNQCAFNPSLL